ncbi:DUF3823 domain-containing protein [Mucilaginibacter sp.]|uniref:DUF3823 domain-containing protein n=1 Tax=Mucilaginibacter sp. TaxID=1882438 RepID=UPI002620A5CB|nr:DUF3823 domain-containing protein [Mucilaginibacter sp.]
MSSCFKTDAYTPPDQTLTGKIIDSSTGLPIQSESGGIQIKENQLDWNGTGAVSVSPDQNLMVKFDGTYNDTKVFKGKYKLVPIGGAFVPPYRTSPAPAIDKSVTVDIQGGTTTVNFTVDPFLKVEWVGEPVINGDKTVSASFKFTRGTADPVFQFPVTDATLYISTTPFVSSADQDNNFTFNATTYNTPGSVPDPVTGKYPQSPITNFIGQTITLTSKLPLLADRTYYIRGAARTADNVNKRYNYNVAKAVYMPQ